MDPDLKVFLIASAIVAGLIAVGMICDTIIEVFG